MRQPVLFCLILLLIACSRNACAQDSLACDTNFTVPQRICPNDGCYQDIFIPYFKNGVPDSFRVDIYNRWGNPVFTSSNVANGWDGKSQDALCPEGSYYWIIRTYYAADKKRYVCTGSVYLLR